MTTNPSIIKLCKMYVSSIKDLSKDLVSVIYYINQLFLLYTMMILSLQEKVLKIISKKMIIKDLFPELIEMIMFLAWCSSIIYLEELQLIFVLVLLILYHYGLFLVDHCPSWSVKWSFYQLLILRWFLVNYRLLQLCYLIHSVQSVSMGLIVGESQAVDIATV